MDSRINKEQKISTKKLFYNVFGHGIFSPKREHTHIQKIGISTEVCKQTTHNTAFEVRNRRVTFHEAVIHFEKLPGNSFRLWIVNGNRRFSLIITFL